MTLYLLRHAIAGERNLKKYPDDSRRPLTKIGAQKMIRVARGMKALGLQFDVVLTSPLTRAKQTAQIVLDTCDKSPPLRVQTALAPGGATAEILKGIPRGNHSESILLVGHEPDLSNLVGDLLLHTRLNFPLEFKKGGLCRIDFDGPAQPGTGHLVFHLTPRILRLLGA